MAANSIDIDLQPIGLRCLDIIQGSLSIGLAVTMSIKIGETFAFNYSSEPSGSCPLPAVFEKVKRKNKSPSARRRDRIRRIAFRNKKSCSPDVSLAPDTPLLDLPEVTSSQKESIASSTSFGSPDVPLASYSSPLDLPKVTGGAGVTRPPHRQNSIQEGCQEELEGRG